MTLLYTHLSLAERREIARMHAAKIPISVIADRLQRHRSTIYREIKRNWVHDEEPLYRGYYHVAADMQARARRQRLGKLSRKPVLAVYVMDRLKAGWSPEQIAGRLRASGAPERLSHETIYRFVYSSQGQKLGLHQDLPLARRRRRARYQRKPRGLVIPAGNTIEQRPAEITARRRMLIRSANGVTQQGFAQGYWMKPPYIHPSLDQRREPFRLSSAKILMLVIAQRLNRHSSTLYREIKPNWFHDEELLYRYPLHFGLPHIRAYSPFSH